MSKTFGESIRSGLFTSRYLKLLAKPAITVTNLCIPTKIVAIVKIFLEVDILGAKAVLLYNLTNRSHTFHHYCLTLWLTKIYIMTYIKEDLISNRKVNMSEMSKINNLRVKKYFNIVCRVNGLESIINKVTIPLDITDQNN